MATTYKNLAQAQAAYDTILKQKQRIQRNDEINRQRAILGVNNYLKQNGYNGGAAESILLRARGNRTDISNYDAQLADLAAIIQGFKQAASSGGGGRAPQLTAAQKLAAAMGSKGASYTPTSQIRPMTGNSNASLGKMVRTTNYRTTK